MQNLSTGLCSTATQDTLEVYFAQCTTQLEMYSSHNSKLPLEKRVSPQWRNYSLLLIIFEQANGASFHQAKKQQTSRKYKKHNRDAVVQRIIRYSQIQIIQIRYSYPGETLRRVQLCKFSPSKEAYQENTKKAIEMQLSC